MTMNRSLWIVFAALSIAACKGDDDAKGGKFDGSGAMGYAKAQLDFGPRIPGTEGAKKAGDWIVAQMRTRADTVIEQTWIHTTQDGKQLPMRNILARFNPQSTSRIL